MSDFGPMCPLPLIWAACKTFFDIKVQDFKVPAISRSQAATICAALYYIGTTKKAKVKVKVMTFWKNSTTFIGQKCTS